MPNPNAKGRNFLTIAILILAGEAIFFLPFILPRVFRPTMLKVFDITNLELGTVFSIYGVVAMFSYFFGGPLADKYPARNLMAVALWMTALGGLVFLQLPSIETLGLIYGYWGFTTIFLFWAALIRATREWGGTGLQGTAFGLLEGGRGASSALIGTLGLVVFSGMAVTGSVAVIDASRDDVYSRVILVTTIAVFVIGLLVLFFVPVRQVKETSNVSGPSLRHFFQLLRLPIIWLQAVIIVCAYVGYKITDDFTLYAYDVLGFDEKSSATLGTVVLWMRPVFALIFGLLADRFSSPRMVIIAFLAMILGGSLIAANLLTNILIIVFLNIAITCVGVYGIRGIYFALMKDAKVPISATGAAVGIMSIVGFTPDVFMSPLMGYLLDNNPGVFGHQLVFGVLVLFATIGLVTAQRFRWLCRGD